MKYFLSALIFALFIVNDVKGQTQTAGPTVQTSPAKGAQITLDNAIFSFGVIPYNSSGKHIFTVTNTGIEPLIIYNCIKGCGCTQVEWTKTPIMPGEKGFVIATYNTKIIGHFSRGVDVYSNDINNSKVNIKLKGEVLVVPGGEVPPVVVKDGKKPPIASPPTDTKW
jgi:hypothetical protein